MLIAVWAGNAGGSVANPFRESRLQLGGFFKGVAESLIGTGKRRTLRKLPSRREVKQTDELVIDSVPGAEVYALKLGGGPPRIIPLRLLLSRKPFELPLGLVIGVSPPSDVLRALGRPSEQREEALVYAGAAEGCHATLTFLFQEGQLDRVEWDGCVD